MSQSLYVVLDDRTHLIFPKGMLTDVNCGDSWGTILSDSRLPEQAILWDLDTFHLGIIFLVSFFRVKTP